MRARFRTLLPLTDGGFGLVTVRRSTKSIAPPLEIVGGFQTTLLPRTLVDLAGSGSPAVVRRAWREADFRGLLDPVAIAEQIERHQRPGDPLIRSVLQANAPVVPLGATVASGPEYDFMELVREAGVPIPEVNVAMTVAGRPYVADSSGDTSASSSRSTAASTAGPNTSPPTRFVTSTSS